MKVIFLQTVPGIAERGQTKEVKPGFAQNFLIPRKIARPLSDDKARSLAHQVELATEVNEQQKQLNKDQILSLVGSKITLEEKASEKGTLFESVNKARLAEKLHIPLKALDLAAPIKHSGIQVVPLLWQGKRVGTIEVDVRPLF